MASLLNLPADTAQAEIIAEARVPSTRVYVGDPLRLELIVQQRADKATIPVRGRPETFTGGVGLFTVKATAQPTRVRVGDPITLTVRVSGAGNLEDVGPPNLAVQPRWANDFKVHEPTPGPIDGNGKTFTFTVRPKKGQVKELPAIRLGFFNPKSKKFEEAFSDRIPLEVLETARLDPSEIVDARPTPSSKRELEELVAGLAANYTGPDVLDPQGPYRVAPAVWAVVALAPPLVWLAVFAAQRRAMRRRQNPARLRAEAAHRRALERLGVAARDPTGPELPEAVARAIANYVADRLNLSAGELTPAEVRHHVLALAGQPELADRFAALLEQCDRARFAPAAAAAESPTLLETARQLIDRSERVAPPNGRRAVPAVLATARVLLAVAVASAATDRLTTNQAAQPAANSPLDRHAILARANAAFERGARADDPNAARLEFDAAIAAYRQLVADGVENGKLYYNLANAYFRAGDVPRAILYYRLAERLLPRDDQVAANLAFARSRVADRIEPTPTSQLLRQLLFAHYSWSVRARTGVAIALYSVSWILFGTRIWAERRVLVFVGSICLLTSAALGYSAFRQTLDDHARPIGVLVANEVVVRKGDGATYEPQFNRPLGPGIEFRVLEQRDNWLRIDLPDSKAGWIRADQATVGGG